MLVLLQGAAARCMAAPRALEFGRWCGCRLPDVYGSVSFGAWMVVPPEAAAAGR